MRSKNPIDSQRDGLEHEDKHAPRLLDLELCSELLLYSIACHRRSFALERDWLPAKRLGLSSVPRRMENGNASARQARQR